MYVLQETVNTGAVSAAGWIVAVASLLITVGWLYYLYR